MAVHRYWCKVLGLPPWTKLDHLYLPLRYGGPGCPKLEVCLPLHLLLTYMSASYSRNEYAIAAAPYLVSETRPVSEGSSLLHHIVPSGLSLAVLPSDAHPDAPIQVEGDVSTLLLLDSLVAATDAAIFGRVHSCAVVPYCPTTSRRVGFSMSYSVLDGEPVVPETMARLLLHVLRDWFGSLWAAAHCVSALWRMFTRLPRKETIMAAVFRSLAYVFQQVQLHELWVEAQHDSHSTDVLSQLNASAHASARGGVQRQAHHEVPLVAHLRGRLALFYQGALVHTPASVATDLYDLILLDSVRSFPLQPSATWCGHAITRLIISTSLPTRVLRRSFSHRQLA